MSVPYISLKHLINSIVALNVRKFRTLYCHSPNTLQDFLLWELSDMIWSAANFNNRLCVHSSIMRKISYQFSSNSIQVHCSIKNGRSSITLHILYMEISFSSQSTHFHLSFNDKRSVIIIIIIGPRLISA